ncbi:group II intron maturase-specific domain-containing protein, partial [Lichenifustis flavocetrariae]|nr:group II intron reverse transcriptase/maturase [Lichenifustis flavocetrariae]
MSLRDLMRRIRHDTIPQQVDEINVVLRGHYAYYGLAGNIRSLFKVYRAVERYWRKMLCSRSWAGSHLTWETFNQIKAR